jgi:vitamin B12 transporter
MSARSALLVISLAVGTAAAQAQEPPDTFRLAEIIVSATRMPSPRAAVPAAVTVLHGSALRARGIHFVADALRDVPGATLVQSGARGGITSLFLRGGESDYVQVMVDGVVLNDPGGAFDFGQLTTDNVERIEIVRGPVSVLYGSDAVAGVVHIITRSGSGAPRITAALGLGHATRVERNIDLCTVCTPGDDPGASYTNALETGIAGSTQRLTYAFGASRYDTEGTYALNNDYDNLSLSGRLGLAASERSGVVASARWTDGSYHYPTDGAGRLVDRNQFRTSRSLALGIEARHALSSAIEARLTFTTHNGEYITDDTPDGPGDTLGTFASRNLSDITRRKANLLTNVSIGGVTTMTLGVESEWQEGTSTFASDGAFGPFESSSENDRTNRAGFVQLITSAVRPFVLTAGARADDNDRFGSHVTWRTGANLRSGSLLLRAAAGTAFKEPTFFENYAEGFTRGNAALEPEQSRSHELGAEIQFLEGRASVGGTWFHQRYRNLIQYIGAPPDPMAPNYVNLGEARSAGLEVEARIRSAGGGSATASYTLLRTVVVDEGTGEDALFVQGETLIRRPRHRLNLEGSAPLAAWLRGGAGMARVGKRDDLDFLPGFPGERVTLPAYTTVGLFLEARPFSGHDLAFSVRADNLLDEAYSEIVNFPAAGRTVFIGVRAGVGGTER